jgi:hypothetical protein
MHTDEHGFRNMKSPVLSADERRGAMALATPAHSPNEKSAFIRVRPWRMPVLP